MKSIKLWLLLFVLALGGAIINAYIAASQITAVNMAVPAIYLILLLAVVMFVNKNKEIIKIGGE